jgi:hypothetical protein
MLNTTRTSIAAAILLAVPLIAGLSACSASGSGEREGSTPTPEASQTPSFDSFEEYRLAFAECMRAKGIDMDDPGNGGQSITQADDAFNDAAKACQSEIGKAPAREGDSGNDADSASALHEEYLTIAACLREHGVDVADPAPGEDLAIPNDVPTDVFETCAPNGIRGVATGGN